MKKIILILLLCASTKLHCFEKLIKLQLTPAMKSYLVSRFPQEAVFVDITSEEFADGSVISPSSFLFVRSASDNKAVGAVPNPRRTIQVRIPSTPTTSSSPRSITTLSPETLRSLESNNTRRTRSDSDTCTYRSSNSGYYPDSDSDHDENMPTYIPVENTGDLGSSLDESE